MHVSALQNLIDNSLNYSKEAPNDSIIQWGHELAPILKKQKEYKTLFQLKQLIATAYATRGDMNMAIDHARQMYKEAKELNYPIGIALSSRAIGDAYLNANMQEPAIESYKEALELLDKIPGSEILEQEILPKFILTLIQTSHMDEARTYLKRFENLHTAAPTPTFHFFLCACKAYYDIEAGNPEKGKASLDEARKISDQLRFLYLRSIFNYILGQYYQAIGEYGLALQQYERLINTPKAPAPNKHIGLQLECAQLLTKMGRTEEACLIYQKANEQKDSLNALSYARQINDLRGMYQDRPDGNPEPDTTQPDHPVGYHSFHFHISAYFAADRPHPAGSQPPSPFQRRVGDCAQVCRKRHTYQKPVPIQYEPRNTDTAECPFRIFVHPDRRVYRQ